MSDPTADKDVDMSDAQEPAQTQAARPEEGQKRENRKRRGRGHRHGKGLCLDAQAVIE